MDSPYFLSSQPPTEDRIKNVEDFQHLHEVEFPVVTTPLPEFMQ
jgi:hypothetical protein